MGNEIIVHLNKGFFSIIIVGIDNKKRFLDQIAANHDGMSRSPGFFALRRAAKAGRQLVKLLEGIFHLAKSLHATADNLLKISLQILSDDKYNFIKARLQGIVNGIINNNLTVWSNRCQLLDALTETGA